MTWIARTLWDLLAPKQRTAERGRAEVAAKRPARTAVSSNSAARPTMQQRYDALVIEMKRAYGLRIRRWRKSSTGCAWEVHGHNGAVTRLLEAPYPKGPMSCAIFLHEVGHHAIGFNTYRPRCLEEFHAWDWALREMRRRGFNVTAAVEKRMAESLHYAVAKARRRGLRAVPAELVRFA